MKKRSYIVLFALCLPAMAFAQTPLRDQLEPYVGQSTAQLMNHLNVEALGYSTLQVNYNQQRLQYDLKKNQAVDLSQAKINTLMQADYLPLLSFTHQGIQQSDLCKVTIALQDNMISSIRYHGQGC
jgi:hypothetical protein